MIDENIRGVSVNISPNVSYVNDTRLGEIVPSITKLVKDNYIRVDIVTIWQTLSRNDKLEIRQHPGRCQLAGCMIKQLLSIGSITERANSRRVYI